MTDVTPVFSIVVPVYNEAGNAAPLCREIHAVLTDLGEPFEILFVNDGSTDSTCAELCATSTEVPELRIVDLDGNFGEAAALSAGFQHARGTYIVTLDGDGQNDPADIPALAAHLRQHDLKVVTGWRQTRQEKLFLRVLPSRIANWLISQVTRLPVHDNGCGLKVYRREVASHTRLPHGFHRFLPAILGVGKHEVGELAVNDRRRRHGESHYGFDRTLIVARDLLALRFILAAPRWFQSFWLAVTASTTVLALVGLYRQSLMVAAGMTCLSAVGGAIWWNLRRYNEAQRKNVYRLCRIVVSERGESSS